MAFHAVSCIIAIFRWSTVGSRLGIVHWVSNSAVEKRLADLLGRHLLALRTSSGLTQEAVAEMAGITRNHYQLLEAGLSKRKPQKPANPRLSTLAGLSDALGTTVPELIDQLYGRETGTLPGSVAKDTSIRSAPSHKTLD